MSSIHCDPLLVVFPQRGCRIRPTSNFLSKKVWQRQEGAFIGSGPGPVRDFGTERALVEPLGPNTGNFPSSWTRFTLLTELNLTVPKARPEAHTFDFIREEEGRLLRARAKA